MDKPRPGPPVAPSHVTSEENGRRAGRRSEEGLRDAPDGGRSREPVGKRRRVGNELATAVAGEQRAHCEMQVAEPGLRRAVAIGRMRGGMQLRLRLGLSWRVLAKVPDGVRDRAVLGDEQQQSASEVKEGAAGHGGLLYTFV